MSRLGWTLLLVFTMIVGGFALIVRRGSTPPVEMHPAPASASALIVPVKGVLPSQLTDTWGQSRAGGARAHHAIDILAPRGTPVLAAAGGTVEKLFESRDGGRTIYIRRADPALIDYYAHLDTYAPDLRESVAVRQGQQIATVGSTGDASPEAPHLHYEIKRMAAGEKWWQGTDVNPYPLLTAAR